MNRDEQIEFMKKARERRAKALERWSKRSLVGESYEEFVRDATNDSDYECELLCGSPLGPRREIM